MACASSAGLLPQVPSNTPSSEASANGDKHSPFRYRLSPVFQPNKTATPGEGSDQGYPYCRRLDLFSISHSPSPSSSLTTATARWLAAPGCRHQPTVAALVEAVSSILFISPRLKRERKPLTYPLIELQAPHDLWPQ